MKNLIKFNPSCFGIAAAISSSAIFPSFPIFAVPAEVESCSGRVKKENCIYHLAESSQCSTASISSPEFSSLNENKDKTRVKRAFICGLHGQLKSREILELCFYLQGVKQRIPKRG